MKTSIAIHWFRQDLRLLDNPSLSAAAEHEHLMPIYILDNQNADELALGDASKWWLHASLDSLNSSLDGNLSVYEGDPLTIFSDIIERFDVEAVYWNRCYEPWRMHRDEKIKTYLKSVGVEVESFNGSLLWEPWKIQKKDGTHYKVFTPYYRKGCLQAAEPRLPLAVPTQGKFINDKAHNNSLDQLDLLPTIPWDKKLATHWNIGEDAAHERFAQFIDEGLNQYKEGRNLPAKRHVSRIAPYLHFGQVSPNQLWYAVRGLGDTPNIDHFCSELGWREFSYSQLFYNPELHKKNLQEKFDHFPWETDPAGLRAWQKGQTGIPMVDAGMRELWQTGFMHNRVRMIVGSFLIKNLRLHWRHGERWFWDTLLDADLANNSAGWQWVAGCGADASPYFRIFNPVTQGKKFDPDGEYIRQYIPEIAALPNKYLFSPWEAPKEILEAANVELGINYPHPIVDLKISRVAALEAFQTLKNFNK